MDTKSAVSYVIIFPHCPTSLQAGIFFRIRPHPFLRWNPQRSSGQLCLPVGLLLRPVGLHDIPYLPSATQDRVCRDPVGS